MGFEKQQVAHAVKETNTLEEALNYITLGKASKQQQQQQPATSAQDANKVQHVMDMGFSKQEAEKALKKCNDDVEAAVNMLLGA